MIVTDYSSTAFDFAYLRKPLLYYQTDIDEFFSGVHTYSRGYFDYERDGFGEVTQDESVLVDKLIEYMQNGCQLKDVYRDRIDRTFPYADQNNSKRVYECVVEMLEK
jgi:CDP-glycerol glycerophosphotransferase (TagB/SpsB family)